jgi:membrane fusion protein (multidrug efflux system)
VIARRSRAWAIALVTVGTGACKRAAPEEATSPVEVHCVAPKPAGIDETISLRGRIEPPPGGDLPVASQVPGRVVKVSVHEGQRIATGDLVAAIDDAPSRDAVRQSEASLAQARAADVNATTTLDRTRALVDRKIAARQELEDAVARADAAHAAVTSANASLDLARRTLGRVYVRSSFSGVVTRVWRGAGALVDGTAATPIVQLAASTGVEFVADATGGELASILEGQAAKGTLVSGGAEFAGTVRARSSALDPATGLGTVRVTLAATTEQAPIGSFGRIVIATAHRDALLVLPAAALRGSVADGAELVFCKGGKAELHTVKIGWRDDQRIEVVEGVTSTDEVAIDHVLGLDNDTPITRIVGTAPPK